MRTSERPLSRRKPFRLVDFCLSLALLSALLKHGDKIHDVGGPLLLGRRRSSFVTMLNLFLDQVFQGVTVFVGVLLGLPCRGHALNELFGHLHLGFSDRFFSRSFELRYIDELTRKAHQLEHESVLLGLYRGEMLPRPYYDLGDGDILPMTERAAKEISKRITFSATLGEPRL
jgi:hypothetical protein